MYMHMYVYICMNTLDSDAVIQIQTHISSETHLCITMGIAQIQTLTDRPQTHPHVVHHGKIYANRRYTQNVSHTHTCIPYQTL